MQLYQGMIKHMLLQAWCAQHHQGDLSATPDKHEAFAVYLCNEAMSLISLTEPGRFYQNPVSYIFRQLVLRHGYAAPDYDPLKSEQHKQRKSQLEQLYRDRVNP